jgi:hypothetical protein
LTLLGLRTGSGACVAPGVTAWTRTTTLTAGACVLVLTLNPAPLCCCCRCCCCSRPQDWDTTTVEWFSNDKDTDIALPEYRLTFLWLEKTLACGVDQVRAAAWVCVLTCRVPTRIHTRFVHTQFVHTGRLLLTVADRSSLCPRWTAAHTTPNRCLRAATAPP